MTAYTLINPSVVEKEFHTNKKMEFSIPIDIRKTDQNTKERYIETLGKKAFTLYSNPQNLLQEHIRKKIIKGKSVYSYKTLESRVLDEIISKDIYSKVNIQFPSRNYIVPALIQHLKENVAYTIVRLDIKNFFESINCDALMQKLEDLNLPSKHLQYIKSLGLGVNRGILRGLPISNLLSEIVMLDIDEEFLLSEDVFFYKRFVDDIVIVGSENLNEDFYKKGKIQHLMERYSLKFHEEEDEPKYKIIKIGVFSGKKNEVGKVGSSSPHFVGSFDFLGYKFSINQNEKNEFNRVHVTFSDKSLKKLLTKTTLSFEDYIKTQDFKLLVNRIKFLTSNYRLFNQTNKRSFNNGIYFGFPQISEHSCLETLDKNLKLQIHRLCSIDFSHKKKLNSLRKFSFYNGFINKTFYHFSVKNIKKIKYIWNF